MRLYSFQIKNFKSIIDTDECKISDIDNIVILAGQNESGKSAVLEALDFFANGPNNKFEKFQRRQGTNNTEVRCCFLIGKYDIEYVKSELSGYDEIVKYLETKKEIFLTRKHEKDHDNALSVDDEFFTDFPMISENLAGGNVDPDTLKQEKIDKPRPELGKEELISKIRKIFVDLLPTFSLYSSFDDLLPSEIPVGKLKESKAVQDFENVFNIKLETLAKISDARERRIKIKEIQNHATDDFNQCWNQTIDSLGGEEKYKFSIEINDAEPKKIIFMVEGEDQIPLYIEQKSMGFRWFSAFHLRLRALMKESDDYEYGTNDDNIIILIDEPGQNLHDVAQKDVKNILDATSKKHIQIIFSTHNPNLIGDINTNDVELTRIRLVSNDKKIGTKVYNVPQFIARKDGGSLDALSPIRTAMGLNSIGSIFDKNKLNVVVEGITDHYYLTALRDLYGYNENLRFIPVCGVANVKSVVSLLIGWGMDYKAVFDDDAQQGRKAYNELKKHFFENNDNKAHEQILKIKGFNGIEDIFSKNDFQKLFYSDGTLPKNSITKSNSELVKESGKELIARMFIEKVKKDKTSVVLDTNSKENIKKIFQWLYGKFNLT